MNRVHVNPTRRRRPGQQPRAGSVQSTARNRRTCALSAAPPRPPSAGQGRLTPARRGPGRQGGDPAGHLTPARRENTRPPAWKTGGRQPGENKTTQPDFPMAVDRARIRDDTPAHPDTATTQAGPKSASRPRLGYARGQPRRRAGPPAGAAAGSPACRYPDARSFALLPDRLSPFAGSGRSGFLAGPDHAFTL